MSEILNLNALLGSLPATSDPNVGNVLAFDSTGNPTKTSVSNLHFVDLYKKEEVSAVLTFEEFAKKYLAPLPPGSMLTSNNPAMIDIWSIQLTDTLTIPSRSYAILLCKRYGNFISPYNYGTVALIPAYTDSPTDPPPLLFVTFQTNGNKTFSYRVYKVPLTQIF